MGRKAKTAIASIRGAGLVTALDVVAAALGSAAFSADFPASLGLLMLLESAALMLIGGALSFSGQPGVRKLAALLARTELDSKRNELGDLDAKAAAYALVGVLLFVETLALAAGAL